jgi:hypothetical protein
VRQPAPTVATITFLDLPGTAYRLRRGKALIAEIENGPAGFVVSEQSTGVFHDGRDVSRSIGGFIRAFVDQFEFLRRNKENLSSSLQAEPERFE